MFQVRHYVLPPKVKDSRELVYLRVEPLLKELSTHGILTVTKEQVFSAIRKLCVGKTSSTQWFAKEGQLSSDLKRSSSFPSQCSSIQLTAFDEKTAEALRTGIVTLGNETNNNIK